MANNSASNDLVSFNSFNFNQPNKKCPYCHGYLNSIPAGWEFRTSKRIKESRKKSYQTYWRYLVLFSCLPQIFQTILLWWKPGKDKTISQKYHQTEETLETLFFNLVDNRTSCPTNTGPANGLVRSRSENQNYFTHISHCCNFYWVWPTLLACHAYFTTLIVRYRFLLARSHSRNGTNAFRS